MTLKSALRSTAAAMAARSFTFASAPESLTCNASNVYRRGDQHGEPLLLRLPNLLGWNLHQVGAAHAQVEPLLADRLGASESRSHPANGLPCQQFSFAVSVSTPLLNPVT